MKKIALMLILFFMTSSSFANCKINTRVTNNLSQYYQDNGQWKGTAVQLIEALLEEANCEPVYIEQPFQRGLESLKNGTIQLMSNLSITEARKEYMNFIGPHRDDTIILMVAEDSIYEINSLDDIKKLPGKIGMVRGGYYGEELKLKLKNDKDFSDKFHLVSKSKQLAPMFQRNRLSGYIIERYRTSHEANKSKSSTSVKEHSFIIFHDFVYFGLSKKSVPKDLLAKLQRAYEQARAKGKFKKVLEEYNN